MVTVLADNCPANIANPAKIVMSFACVVFMCLFFVLLLVFEKVPATPMTETVLMELCKIM